MSNKKKQKKKAKKLAKEQKKLEKLRAMRREELRKHSETIRGGMVPLPMFTIPGGGMGEFPHPRITTGSEVLTLTKKQHQYKADLAQMHQEFETIESLIGECPGTNRALDAGLDGIQSRLRALFDIANKRSHEPFWGGFRSEVQMLGQRVHNAQERVQGDATDLWVESW